MKVKKYLIFYFQLQYNKQFLDIKLKLGDLFDKSHRIASPSTIQYKKIQKIVDYYMRIIILGSTKV